MRISATSTFLTRSLVRGRMREREGHEKGHEEIWKNLGNSTVITEQGKKWKDMR